VTDLDSAIPMITQSRILVRAKPHLPLWGFLFTLRRAAVSVRLSLCGGGPAAWPHGRLTFVPTAVNSYLVINYRSKAARWR
jgi:hypothetical protein